MEKSNTDNKFLGTEKVGKLLRMFAIPCVLSLIIQALYNIVDQVFISHSGYLPLGNNATGVVYPLTVIALALGLFIGDGAAAMISINQGKNKTQNTHKTIGTGITIGFIVSLVLMAICFGFATPILKYFGAEGKVSCLKEALEYSTFIFIGFPAFILACIINPVIRADGSPKYAMFAMAIGAIVNIILDLIFIFVAKMGMNGAAIATFIGQVVSLIFHLIYLFKAKNFKLKLKSFIPNFKLLFESLKLGISSFLTQISIVIITISRQHGAGGREIGQKLAKKLDVPFYDKELTALAAQESGLAEEYIEKIEEKSSILYDLYLSTEANKTAIKAQEHVLKEIAEKGSCVIVGRAADYVLKDYNPFKVFIYAPNEFKQKRIMTNYGDSENLAMLNMENADKRRAKFYENITGQTWGDAKNYNLSIDSSVGIEKTVQQIYLAVQKDNKKTKKQP